MKKFLSAICIMAIMLLCCATGSAEEEYPSGLWGLLDDTVVYYIAIHDDGNVYLSTFLAADGSLVQSVQFKTGGIMEINDDGDLVMDPMTFEHLTYLSPVEDADEIAGTWAYVQDGIAATMTFDGEGNYFSHSYSTIPGIELAGEEGTYTLNEDMIATTSTSGKRSYNTYSIVGELLVMIPSGSTEAMTWTRLDKE